MNLLHNPQLFVKFSRQKLLVKFGNAKFAEGSLTNYLKKSYLQRNFTVILIV